ncbi:MAG: phosphomethylpyrimidine synthase [Candidatus Syntrophoarchaeum caldarius]|uniref:Phosphomethylpyrimidine synthase n=1 Tax=Candidatus Syntropharchaeum caldarium TaxID=1838285 RepID=A0A1F2P968_9EURY|nr:MAG: phosphomethylpyrimidine synthase [Candidatus Syntrophoarchaeum caldarius]
MTLITDAMAESSAPKDPVIIEVARMENLEPQDLARLIARGRVVIPANVNRDINARIESGGMRAVGERVSTKINANIGTSKDYINFDDEIRKAETAVKYGADAVMDLSTGGEYGVVRREILKKLSVPIGTVPIYDACRRSKTIVDTSSDDMFNAVREHAKDGVDFVTIHAGVNLNTLERLKKSKRVLDVVSRGGAFTIAWMVHNERENPFYAEFDYLLEIANEFDLTISLGDGMRSGCTHDATDRAKFAEYIALGELVSRSRSRGVQAIVEGPGHVPLDEISVNVQAMKHLTDHAPLYLLGPLVTDLGGGYDHITAAIGGAVAGMHGADFLCMTTPSEHFALPTEDDIREATVVTRIAAHVVDTVKEGVRDAARMREDEMADARRNLDWERQFKLLINPERARAMYEKRPSNDHETCSMCGDLCAIKIVKDVLSGE